ncbi:Fic family protein [Patescibacteria group bacterium]|nr:Fic family protein [Patescibacteria group bacterium]MBU4161995.1 Fic family protein [Patescibacteria group bacterium]
MFNPKYKLTDKIVAMLTAIATAKAVIERAKILPKQELQLRRQALIRMTHSSTGIEGNQLNLHQVEAVYAHKKVDAPDRDIYEAQNYLNAIRYIEQVVRKKQPITEKIILRIHKLVTDKTLAEEQCGKYREGPIYVVRQRFGMPKEIVYTGPESKSVPKLMAELVEWVRKSEEQDIHPVIAAGIVHQEIAAIHPFIDGNGRTARALATFVLYQRGFDFRRLFALEDYYNEDRPAYYQAINIGENYEKRKTDITPWLEYFVRGFKEEIDNVKIKVASLSLKKIDDKLHAQIYINKNQMKILEFIDQMGKITASDVVDILECPKRTAQAHLQRLKTLKIIKQVGKGPASAYILT